MAFCWRYGQDITVLCGIAHLCFKGNILYIQYTEVSCIHFFYPKIICRTPSSGNTWNKNKTPDAADATDIMLSQILTLLMGLNEKKNTGCIADFTSVNTLESNLIVPLSIAQASPHLSLPATSSFRPTCW